MVHRFTRGEHIDPKKAEYDLLHDWYMPLIIKNGHEVADTLRHYMKTSPPPNHPLLGFTCGPNERCSELEVEVFERARYLRVCVERADWLIERADTTASVIDVTAEGVHDGDVRRRVYISVESARDIARKAQRRKADILPLLAKMEEVLATYTKWIGQYANARGPSDPPLVDRWSPQSALRLALDHLRRSRPIAPPPPWPYQQGVTARPIITGWKGPIIAWDGRGSGAPPREMW